MVVIHSIRHVHHFPYFFSALLLLCFCNAHADNFSTSVEGIELSSHIGTDAFLIGGESDDIVLNYIFIPPNGSVMEDYVYEFSCDVTMVPVISTSDSCLIKSEQRDVDGGELKAVNVSVRCTANQFPGTAYCGLQAAPTKTVRNVQNRSIRHRKNKQYSTIYEPRVFESEKLIISVFGIVFYQPDSSGQISRDAVIYSGNTNAYEIPAYDRSDQGVRQLSLLVHVPGAGTLLGTAVTHFFSQASVSTDCDDIIIWYNSEMCSITNAGIENGSVLLPSVTNCGIGINAEDNGSAKLGFNIRPYKSGYFTLRMAWNNFGSSFEPYEQAMSFMVLERAPPVLKSISSLTTYRSVPCGTEKIIANAYNVRFAESMVLRVENDNGVPTMWPEVVSDFSYDNATDTATIAFDSAGGSGTNVPVIIIAKYGGEELESVVLNPSLSAAISFSNPPSITSMFPLTAKASGRTEITIAGSLEHFTVDDNINVGGYSIPGSEVSILNSTSIVFQSPPLSSLGLPTSYDISVGICAEKSNSIPLVYETYPSLIITGVDTDEDGQGHYIVAFGGESSFLASTSGNIEGLDYAWELVNTAGDEIDLRAPPNNVRVLTITASMLTFPNDVYKLTCTVRNSLGFTDSATILLRLTNQETLLVSVYPLRDLSVAIDTVTLVQASVQLISESSELVPLQSQDLDISWNYRGEDFTVGNETATSDVTGPTKLGLAFNIARKDLLFGNTKLSLSASLISNPLVNGTASTNITVIPSPLVSEINNGINGSVVLSGQDLVLSGANSNDPDVIGGEASDGLSYFWFSCLKSLTSTFSGEVQDCTAIIPLESSDITITIAALRLSQERMDIAPHPGSTYMSFGLRVSKDGRSTDQYVYFELKTLSNTLEPVPHLSGLSLVDIKGMPLQHYSVFSDIIIRPESNDSSATWVYDMVSSHQRFLLTKNGVLKSGPGFTTSRGVKSRNLLGFSAGSLEASTEYRVSVKVSTSNSSLQSGYEISFRTDDTPTLSCIPPMGLNGTVYRTSFLISAQLSFETQGIEYCFYLIGGSGERYTVGKGCSSVQFAKFTFPFEGSYGMECLAKTVDGAIIDNVTLPDPLVVDSLMDSSESTQLEFLALRLDELNSELTTCEALRDHACIELLISIAAEITEEVSEFIATSTSSDSNELIGGYRYYISKLASISASLAENTIYRPNQVEESLKRALNMAQVSSAYIESETTLFDILKSAYMAVNSTRDEGSTPVMGKEIVDTVIAIANLTIATSFSLSHEGSSRERLRKSADAPRSAFAVVLNAVTSFIVQMRAQQETCGYVGMESTEYPKSLGAGGRPVSADDLIPPIAISMKVACTRSQVHTHLSGSNALLEVTCDDVLEETELKRLLFTLMSLPKSLIASTGLVQEIESYIDPLVFFGMSGVERQIPNDCFRLEIRRDPSTLNNTGYQDLRVGFLRNIPDAGTDCSQEDCFVFEQYGSATYSTSRVIIRTNDTGLVIAGNFTGERPPSDSKSDKPGPPPQELLVIVMSSGVFCVFIGIALLGYSGICVEWHQHVRYDYEEAKEKWNRQFWLQLNGGEVVEV